MVAGSIPAQRTGMGKGSGKREFSRGGSIEIASLPTGRQGFEEQSDITAQRTRIGILKYYLKLSAVSSVGRAVAS